MKRMFSEVEMSRDVAIPAKHLKGHSPPHQHILTRLLKDLLNEKACREHGFYLAITALKSIGKINNNNINSTDDDNPQADTLTFPVSFTCRTFLPSRGNIMVGTVMKLLFNGPNGAATAVLISSGPLRYAYLSYLKMPDYRFVPAKSEEEEEEACFQKDDHTKIAVGVVVRFLVLGRRFKVNPEKRRTDVYVLASVDGDDSLGPVSLTGCDRPYM